MRRALIIGFLLLCGAANGLADPVPHLFLDCRATNLDRNNHYAELMIREIPRQALLVAIEEDLGTPCIVRDATAEPAAVPQSGDIQIGVEAQLLTGAPPQKSGYEFRLFNAQNVILDTTDLPLEIKSPRTGRDAHTPAFDAMAREKWLPAIVKEASLTTGPAKYVATLPAPARVDDLLKAIDINHAFLAARLTHAAVAESGESIPRMVALVRAYSNLGDATRHLFNGQSSAFFARAFIYSDRLSAQAPDDPLSWWAAAYADALFGSPEDASAELDLGDKLAVAAHTATPDWVELTRSLVKYDSTALFNQIGQNDSGLPSYFAFLTVEHAMLPSLPINFARAALQQNPDAIRLETAITENGGVGVRHQSTEEAPKMLNRMMSHLATDADDPAVRDAATVALQQRYSQSAVITLRSAMESRPAEPGRLLPWSTYASIIRECEFIDAVDRLVFVAFMWGVDPSDEIRAWWPLVEDHRYAPLLAAIPAPNEQPKPDLVAKVLAIPFKDDVDHSMAISFLFYNLLHLSDCPHLHESWTMRHQDQLEWNAHDKARLIWEYRGSSNARDYVLSQTKILSSLAKQHPLIAAEEALLDWDTFAPNAAEVEKTQAQNPIVAYALGVGYAQHGQAEKAIPLLQAEVKVAPDYESYSALARAYLVSKDEKSWQKTYDDYLANVEDLGLNHAQAGQAVADHLNGERRYNDALPYAKIAADSYSAWGLYIYAQTLAHLHQYDQADQVIADLTERYGDPKVAYRFCITTGHGDRAAIAKTCGDWYQNQAQHGAANNADYAVYLILEGHPDQADEQLDGLLASGSNPCEALLSACLAVEQKDENKARSILLKAEKSVRNGAKDERYNLCIDEFRRCLTDPTAIPARDGKLVASFADFDGANQRGNSAYIMGRLCEDRNKSDDAKWWYRQSLDSEADDFTYRPLAAEALRRMGEDYFK